MTSDAIDLLRKRIVPLFQEDLAQLERGSGICELTNIYMQDGFKVVDSYGVETIQSDVARIFTLGSYDRIGLFQGTWENPTQAMRYMDYKGATMVIPTSNGEKPEFWCSGNYVPKIAPQTPFLTKPIAGSNAYVALLDDSRPMLVIAITPRKELWFKNLMVGDENTLVYCHETGAVIIPKANWKEFKSEFLKLNKKSATEALNILKGTNKGYILPASNRVQDFFKSNMDFALSCKNLLPSQPQARSFWLTALGAVK